MISRIVLVLAALAPATVRASADNLYELVQVSQDISAAGAEDQTSLDSYHAHARDKIREVLAAREYADLHVDRLDFWRRLREWFEPVLASVASMFEGLPPWAFWTIIVWMILALLAILAHLIYTLMITLGGTARVSDDGGSARTRKGELLGIRDLDFDSVYAEARRLLGAGDWASACRYLYVAAILGLDRRGAIAFRPSKTNRDYVEELASRGGLQSPFRRLTGCFESVAYGGRPPTRSSSHDMAHLVEDLIRETSGAVSN